MPTSRDSAVFSRITVDYSLAGSARVEWEMRDNFLDPQPWSFVLQVSRDSGASDPWAAVGSPVVNEFFALDDEQRQRGKALHIGYRVVLSTSVDTYTSNTAQVMGLLSKHQWLQARAIRRRAILQSRSMQGLPGYLMKRKLYGTACTVCVDPITGGVTNSDCAVCLGTSRVDGYWKAVEDTMFDITPEGDDTKRSDKGTVNDAALMGRFIAPPALHRGDVWIDRNSDRRYVVNKVRHDAEMNRVPIIISAELRLAEFNDIIYTIDPTEGN